MANPIEKKVYRNNQGFVTFAYIQFALFAALALIGLWTLKEPLMVKGYYLMAMVGLVGSTLVLAKVARDKQEDDSMYDNVLNMIRNGEITH